MFNRLSIKAKLLLALFLLNSAGTAAFTLLHYQSMKEEILEGIDKHLYAIAYGASHILPAEFHASIKDASSVTPEEHQRNAEIFTRYAHQTGAKYIYSLMQFGDNIVFTANTTINEPFFDVYKTASPALRTVFTIGQPWIGNDEDAHGAYRSVYLPFTTDNGRTYVIGADIAIDFVHAKLRNALWSSLINGAIRFLFVFAVIYLMVDHIVKPLNRLTRMTHELGEKGFILDEATARNIDAIGRGRGDEVGSLARTLQQMTAMLENHIAQLRETTVMKERIESELRIAHDIQMGILPRIFPPFPDCAEFDLYAAIEPAREVGGDLYDYFMIDDQHLFFMIGDVSDKKIPATLFMAITKTLFAATRRRNLPINAILSQVNQQLAAANPSEMFVTVFAGIFDLQTGNIEYSNAGHEPPLIYRRSQQWIEALTQPVTIALGLIEDFVYPVSRLTLYPGDTLLLFTDGLNQARDANQQPFTVQRIEVCLRRVGNTSPEEIVEGVLRAVHEYAGNTPQLDDITLLALRYNGMCAFGANRSISKPGRGGSIITS